MINFKNPVEHLFIKKKLQIFFNIYKIIFYYLSKKFINFYQEREKITIF